MSSILERLGNTCSQTQQLSLKEQAATATALAIAIAGNYPFWALSQQFAGPIAGPIMGACNLTGFGIFRGWCLKNLFDKAHSTPSSTPKHCKKFNQSLAVLAGILSQAPVMYLAYLYNNRHLAFPIVVGCAESAPAILSSLWSVEDSCEKKEVADTDLFKKELAGRIQLFLSELPIRYRELHHAPPSSSWKKAIGWASVSQREPPDILPAESSEILDLATTTPYAEPAKSPAWAAKAFGAILTAYTLSLYGRVSYSAVQEWSGNPYLAGGAAALTVAANGLITGKFIVDAAANFYRGSREIISGTANFPLAQALSPKAWVALRTLSLIIAWGSFGPTGLVSKEDFPSPVREVFLTLAPFAAAFLISALLPKILDEVLEYCSLRYGSPTEQQYARLNRGLRRFLQDLDEARPDEIEALRTALPAHITERLEPVPGTDVSLLSAPSDASSP